MAGLSGQGEIADCAEPCSSCLRRPHFSALRNGGKNRQGMDFVFPSLAAHLETTQGVLRLPLGIPLGIAETGRSAFSCRGRRPRRPAVRTSPHWTLLFPVGRDDPARRLFCSQQSFSKKRKEPVCSKTHRLCGRNGGFFSDSKKEAGHLPCFFLVGMAGFEPAASWSRTKHATICATSRKAILS